LSRRFPRVLAVAAALAVAITACSTTPQADSSSAPSASGAPGAPQKVTLQLQWFTQGQFAGYFAAVEQGFYEKQGLDV
jgi:NitT/TauT family transport system substrate-binding protein